MRWLSLLLLFSSGCKKEPPKPAVTEEVRSGFVPIDMDFGEDFGSMDASALRSVSAECGDLRDLEPAAIMGQLTDDSIRCLDNRVNIEERQTIRNKVSRVLLTDAWGKGDDHRWLSLGRRHLEKIDRSDPDLVYKVAYQLANTGHADEMDEALFWADVALENRSHWTGTLHVNRVNGLMRIRAVAAQKKWKALEEQYARNATTKLELQKEEARNQTKTLSREWLEYSKAAGMDSSPALRLCISAAAATEFCEVGE